MILIKNCKWSELENEIKDKKVYCFGGGNLLTWLSKEISGYSLAQYVEAIIDNNVEKCGSLVVLDDIEIPIIGFEEFLASHDGNTIVIITSSFYFEIIEQLDNEPSLDRMPCYIEVFLEEEAKSFDHWETTKMLIPKKIHYCWFGGKELPAEYKKYIGTWRKYCPDYEIIRWDESNYDYMKHTYMKQAYEAGKYAFVSDYARLDIIYNQGGIYLDTDVEVVKNLDALLSCEMFCGFEQGNLIATGLGFGAIKGFEYVKQMRDMYDGISFVLSDGTYNLTACPYIQTRFMKTLGLSQNGIYQNIKGISVFPRICFAPLDYYGVYNNCSQDTYMIHHYSASWMGEKRGRDYWLGKNNVIWKRIKQDGKQK